MRLGGWLRSAAVFAMVAFLGACAAQMQETAREEGAAEAPKTPVVLRSVPRYVQFAPLTEWVYLWDRPGGPSARAVRVARVPSGTEGLVVEKEVPRPFSTEFLDAIGADNTSRQPVRWVRVVTPRGEGWVRQEFLELR